MDIVYKDMVTKAHQVGDFNTGGSETFISIVCGFTERVLSGNRCAADHSSLGLHQEGHGDPGEERVRQPSI